MVADELTEADFLPVIAALLASNPKVSLALLRAHDVLARELSRQAETATPEKIAPLVTLPQSRRRSRRCRHPLRRRCPRRQKRWSRGAASFSEALADWKRRGRSAEAQLLQLLADPAKVEARLTALRKATETHEQRLAAAKHATAAHDKRQADLEAWEARLTEQQKAQEARQAAPDQADAAHAESLRRYAEQDAELQRRIAAFDHDSGEASCALANSQAAAQQHARDIEAKQADLDRREAAVVAREAALREATESVRLALAVK